LIASDRGSAGAQLTKKSRPAAVHEPRVWECGREGKG
jgi:hypothetical protein